MMIQPNELKLNLPMQVANGVNSNTTKVWNILVASRNGDLDTVRRMVNDCPELIYAQYNYTPPIHFAVREGHAHLIQYLLNNGAHDPDYRVYPFLDSLVTIALDRNANDIARSLQQYAEDPLIHKFKGDNGKIFFGRSEEQLEFERAVGEGNLERTRQMLHQHPGYALDETYCWGEGILLRPAKTANYEMMELLMSYGAKVPSILKWTQAYYFERYDSAAFLLQKGMNPNTMSWHHVTILHDMAQKGNILKAELLINHGADINAVEEEYQSTPLGMAVRWGHKEMVKYLLAQGADATRSGAAWSTPVAWARKKGHFDIEEILMRHGVKE